MAKIYIDAGHGGHDSGAVGKRSKEKDNVLKVAKQTKKLLESKGHTVRLSRSTDVYLTLTQRTNDANRWGADVFVSLHNNSATSSSATGFETFIYNGNVSSATKRLQRDVHSAILKEIKIRDRGMKRANFAVVRQSKMPSVLIEYAFINNTSDESILINKVGEMSKGTANGILKFLGSSTISKTPSVKPSKPSAKPSKPASKPNYKADYKTNSIVVFLQSINHKWDFAYRKQLANAYNVGRGNYKGTLPQNTELLKRLKADYKKTGKLKTSKIVASKPSKPKKSVSQMATEIINNPKAPKGHSNRRKWLGISQAEYAKVRAEVNRRLR